MLFTDLTVRSVVAASSDAPGAPIPVGHMCGVMQLDLFCGRSLRSKQKFGSDNRIIVLTRTTQNFLRINAYIALLNIHTCVLRTLKGMVVLDIVAIDRVIGSYRQKRQTLVFIAQRPGR